MKINKKVKFTICIPTFNRGKRAYDGLISILKKQKIPKKYKILILDNASNAETNYYLKIKEIATNNKQLEYVRHSANKGFTGNYLACFELCTSDYFMIVSDEDIPKMSSIQHFIAEFNNNKELCVIRGSVGTLKNAIPAQAAIHKDEYFQAGEEALMNFTLTNNYISGIVYNKKLLIKYKLLKILQKNFVQHQAYPHLYFEMLISAKCDVMRSSRISIYEGEMQKSTVCKDTGVSYNPSIYQYPFSFGSRIDQIVALRNGYIEAVTSIKGSDTLFINLYFRLADKYFFLISMANANMYVTNNLSMTYIRKSTLNFLCASILNYQAIEKHHEEIIKILNNLYDKYEKHDKK